MLPAYANINVLDVFELGHRCVFVISDDVAKVPIVDPRGRVAVRNVATGRLSYVPWQRLAGSKRRAETSLLLAARDMYEALKGLLADIEEYQRINHLGGQENHWQIAARAAIAKAETVRRRSDDAK